MDIFTAECEIIKRLEKMAVPGHDESLWELMACQFSKNGACDQFLVDMAEDVIRKYLERIKKKDIFEMWRETEVGLGSEDEIDTLYVDSLRMDVEVELLVRITNAAGSDCKS